MAVGSVGFFPGDGRRRVRPSEGISLRVAGCGWDAFKQGTFTVIKYSYLTGQGADRAEPAASVDSGVFPIGRIRDERRAAPPQDAETAEDPVQEALGEYSLHFGLSVQERRLLECAVAGNTDKAASSSLGCSPNTIGTYWRRIYGKVGCLRAREVVAHFCRFALRR